MVATLCTCVYTCVGLKFECAFSMHSSPALKCSLLAQNAFFPCAKSVCLQRNKHDCVLFARWFKKTLKIMKSREKSFSNTSFQLRTKLKKGQKQGRDDRAQEDYLTSAVHFCRCLVVFLCSFISSLFRSFFSSILNWNKGLEKLFPIVNFAIGWRTKQSHCKLTEIHMYINNEEQGVVDPWAT